MTKLDAAIAALERAPAANPSRVRNFVLRKATPRERAIQDSCNRESRVISARAREEIAEVKRQERDDLRTLAQRCVNQLRELRRYEKGKDVAPARRQKVAKRRQRRVYADDIFAEPRPSYTGRGKKMTRAAVERDLGRKLRPGGRAQLETLFGPPRRRNPGGLLAAAIAYLEGGVPARRNPETLHGGRNAEARRLSRIFHGTDEEVAVLTKKEQDRRLPREVTVIGQVTAVRYRPDKHSARGDSEWEHASGDNGMPFGVGNSKRKPLLVVDPRTKRPEVLFDTSDMKFSPQRGLVR